MILSAATVTTIARRAHSLVAFASRRSVVVHGEGWLALRYIFDDLEDMQAFPSKEAFDRQANMMGNSHYDHTRKQRKFKGFFLKDV